jgi:prephenate dehydrogenase
VDEGIITHVGKLDKVALPERVCIVGLGLMGGSLALALRGRVPALIGVDAAESTRHLALTQQIVHHATADLQEGIQHADLVVLATPARTILRMLAELPRLRPGGCLVLDIGSTKQLICEAMEALPEAFAAIGGHPMCGRETAGLTAATPDLYREQTFILCRNKRTSAAIESIALRLIEVIGGRPLFLSPHDNDRAMAAVSHLPYIVAATLFRRPDETLWPVSASGFRDTTRLAGTDPQMILDVLLTNRQAILTTLEKYQADMEAFRIWLETGDEHALREWLGATQSQHQAYRTQTKA